MAEMTPHAAAQVLATVAAALQRDPSQFAFQVTTGTRVEVHVEAPTEGPVTGMSVTATGGAPGSQTIGMISEARAGQSTIQKVQAAGEVQAALRELAAVLQELSVAAEAQEKGRVQAGLERLKRLVVAPALVVDLAVSVVTLAQLV